MAKNCMPMYGIIDILRAILAHNLAEYQNFSMRPGLPISTTKLHILSNLKLKIP